MYHAVLSYAVLDGQGFYLLTRPCAPTYLDVDLSVELLEAVALTVPTQPVARPYLAAKAARVSRAGARSATLARRSSPRM